jgi:hypothetical protein
MSQPSQAVLIRRKVTNPYSKLTRLCQAAAIGGGKLKTFAAVAKAVGVVPSRVTQQFGYGQESEAPVIRAATLGEIVRAFKNDGVRCEIDWFYLTFEDFEDLLSRHQTTSDGPGLMPGATNSSDDWERSETTVLPDLVELRLHPPRPGNEIPDSHYVDATLLFGVAECDYEPDDGQEARTISIALRNARMAVGSDSYRPLPETMLGERVKSDCFERVAGGIEITGPAPDGVLVGSPLGGEHLAVIGSTNTCDDPFVVTVAANRGSFVVADANAPAVLDCADAPSTARNAILSALIYKNLKYQDESGRAVLARTTLKRRSRTSNRE